MNEEENNNAQSENDESTNPSIDLENDVQKGDEPKQKGK